MRATVLCLTLVWWAVGAMAQERPSAPVETSEGEDYATKVDWENGFVEVMGEATCDPALAVNQGHCYTMALKGARALAFEKLAETVHGLHITSSNTFQDEVISNTSLRTAVNGLIKDARIISEEQILMPDGSPLVRVKLGIMIAGPRGLGAAVARHVAADPLSPHVAKMRADLERALAELEATRQRAQRLEVLVQQAQEAAQEAREAAASRDDWQVTRALEQASAALQVAQEARRAAEEVARRAAEAQEKTNAATSEDARKAQEAAQEAREIAARLERVASEAQAAADEARQASASAGAQARLVADVLERARETAAQVEAARGEADRLRRDAEVALTKLVQAHGALAAENATAAQALEEARTASEEARRAREQAVALERQLREARLAVDSLTARAVRAEGAHRGLPDETPEAARRDEQIQALIEQTRRLSEELAAARLRQVELEQATTKAMEHATKTLETAPWSPEMGALLADLKASVAQTHQLQAAVASLERRAALAEAETARMREVLEAGGSNREEVARALAEATAASRAVRALLDSLRAAAPAPPAPRFATMERVVELSREPYTGLIVDAAYLGAAPVVKPRVFSPDGEEVYGETKVSRAASLRLGTLATYAETPETARTKASARVGRNPLVVRAIETIGEKKADLVVSREDAVLIERADRVGGFLKEGKVVITLMPRA